MNNQENWIVIGRFGKPHGIKGFISVHSYTDPRENILNYKELYVRLAGQWQQTKLLTVQAHNKSIIAQIAGYPERENVSQLTNSDIGIQREQLASLEAGEYYWHQLIGLDVVNTEGHYFGKVVEIQPTGSNDVLIVQGEKRHLIPYLPQQFIVDINLNDQKIIVDWGLDF